MRQLKNVLVGLALAGVGCSVEPKQAVIPPAGTRAKQALSATDTTEAIVAALQLHSTLIPGVVRVSLCGVAEQSISSAQRELVERNVLSVNVAASCTGASASTVGTGAQNLSLKSVAQRGDSLALVFDVVRRPDTWTETILTTRGMHLNWWRGWSLSVSGVGQF